MAQQFQPIRYQDLSGGVQTTTAGHLMLDSELRVGINVILDEIGIVKKRLGYTQIGGQIASSQNILGNYYFNASNSIYSQHIVACNGTIYYNNSGTWTGSSSGWAASTKLRFESFLDRVFAFNGSDTSKSWSGTGAWDSTDLSNAPICKYGRVFQDRFYLANETANQSRVYFSSVPTSGVISWDDDDYLDVNPEDGQSITGLDENNGRLLIFKSDSLFRWDGASTEADSIIDVGTSSQESVKTIHGITYFTNRFGVYAYDGGMPYLISRKIQKWVDAVDQTALGNINSEVDNDHYYVAVGSSTVDGVTYSNVVWVYNIPLKAWTIWKLADTSKAMASYLSSGTRYISFGDSNGEVFQLNSGNTDDGTAIEVNIETKPFDLGTPEEIKQWTECFILTEKAKGLVEVGVKIDDNSVETIGSVQDDATRIPSRLQGRKIAVCLFENGTTEAWSFLSIVFREVFLLGVI